jgi:hypothetical protein
MLDFDRFLPAEPDDMRRFFWKPFDFAQCFFRDQLNFEGTVEAVDRGEAVFETDLKRKKSRIEFPLTTDGIGALFHEMTHDLFHYGPFHRESWAGNAQRNEPWGEAFCEAFRYVLEKDFHLKSNWTKRFEEDDHDPDSNKERAMRILGAADLANKEGLARLWKRIIAEFDHTIDFLDKRFPKA